jgi:hypothetical protein
MLLYGTEEPAQPSDSRYGQYQQQFHRPINNGQQQHHQTTITNLQVGNINNNRHNGGNNKNKNIGNNGWPNWFSETRGGNLNNNNRPQQHKKINPTPQFSSNNIFGNFIRHLSRIVNSRRD